VSKVRLVTTVGTVTAVVVGALIAFWMAGELTPWHIGFGALFALTALLKNINLYRNSQNRPRG
jgi:1,4-dihydroxy-2-naphthoate octaprenyltransferase|tara:strand:- start:389 stop:577 length:189 start_codon:yes stop_codon:yes gene_type:complete